MKGFRPVVTERAYVGWLAYHPDYGGPPEPVGWAWTKQDAIERWLEMIEDYEEGEEE